MKASNRSLLKAHCSPISAIIGCSFHGFGWDPHHRASSVERRARKSVAFTLVEILVTVVIIALLAGLLAPALAGARQHAKATVCINNLKQLGAAVQMYWDENNGKINGLSGIFPTWNNTSFTQAWSQLLFPYVKTTSIYLDPGRPPWMPELPIDYYLNLLPAYVQAGSPGAGIYSIDSKEMTNPSAFILMSEDLWANPLQEIDPTNETGDRTGFSGISTNYPPYHAGQAHFLFADGHVAPFHKFDASQMTYWYDVMSNWQANQP